MATQNITRFMAGHAAEGMKAINLPRSEFDRVMVLKKESDQNCAQAYQFYKKCIITLLSLKTVKRVQKEFPEAIEFLPTDSVATPDDLENLKKLL